MKTSTRKTMSVSNWMRIGSFAAVTTALSVALSAGCTNNTAEGDPCDIALSHDECAGAPTAQCIIPMNCQGPIPTDGSWYDPRATGNAFCCSPNSTAAACQPCMTAPPGEGGAGGEDGGASEAAPAEAAPMEAAPAEAAPKEAAPAEAAPAEAAPAETGPIDASAG